MVQQYSNYYNLITKYFKENKLKYFKDGSFNYNKFPKDVRSNSILERYNRIIKSELGAKRSCNWVIFLNFINNEINRITEVLAKNENINILYKSKTTKFGKDKYVRITNQNKHILNSQNIVDINKIENISTRWLIQKGNNCRYNSFITFMYFTITPFISSLRDKKLILLNKLNELILNLSNNINDKNYYNIIIFLKKINLIQIIQK